MELKIADNIRKLRKDKSLTQEQLATAFGVSIGAVSKWESGASVPDISIILEMASFFGVSTDYLLGYSAVSEDREAIHLRIRKLRNEWKFEEAASAAEQAMLKYPNDFELIHYSAGLYTIASVHTKKEEYFKRAHELHELSITLLYQNSDPKVNEWTIRNDIAHLYLWAGKNETALEKLRENNAGDLNSDEIGMLLIESGDIESGMSHLSYAYYKHIGKLFDITRTFTETYAKQKKYKEALHISKCLYELADSLLIPGKMSFMNELKIMLLSFDASVYALSGDLKSLEETLIEAYRQARIFDAAPDHSFTNTRHYYCREPLTAFYNFGETAEAGLDDLVKDEKEGSPVYEAWRRAKMHDI